jgi:hypothetical protein
MANPNWTKGKSGNPAGRPKKDRALTAILLAAGSKAIQKPDGKKVSRKSLMADLLWRAITEGEIELPNGKKIEVGAADWFDTVEFLYKHIDGPPVQKIAPTDPSGENPYMSMDADALREIARRIANAGNDTAD